MNWYMMIVVYDKSGIHDIGVWRKMVYHVQVHKIMLRCVAVHYVHSTPVKMHSRSPTAMAFWPVCLGILAYSCQNTSRDTIFMKITTSSLRACAYLPAACRHVMTKASQTFPVPAHEYQTSCILPKENSLHMLCTIPALTTSCILPKDGSLHMLCTVPVFTTSCILPKDGSLHMLCTIPALTTSCMSPHSHLQIKYGEMEGK